MVTHLIDKDALVTEIERRTNELWELLPDASKVENGSITTSEACNTGKYTALESFRRFIDTLEVKEVDLEKEIESLVEDNSVNGYYREDVYETAEHFFELGLKAQKGE